MLANLFDLSAIADIGSAVAMVIFLLLGVAGLRLRRETGSSAVVIGLAMAMTTVVLVLFSIDTLENDPGTFVAMVVIALLAVVVDQIWTRARDRGAGPTQVSSAPSP